MTATLELRDAYYARVAPLYGEALRNKTFGIVGGEKCLEIALLLARCGVCRFAAGELTDILRQKLCEQNPLEDRYEFRDLTFADVVLWGPGGARAGIERPVLKLSFPQNASARMRLDVFAAGCVCDTEKFNWPNDPFDCADAANRAAAFARAMLLRNESRGAAETSKFIDVFANPAILIGHTRWPWWIRGFERADADEFLQVNSEVENERKNCPRRGRILIVGCGSLGSVAAVRLAPLVESLVLCDPERVAIENPVRQEFRIADVGTFKSEALARRCCELGGAARGSVRAEEDSKHGAQALESLLETENPDLVILATGTGAEFMAASVLRRRGIPHVAARCYARARYFEIIAVDGARGPCFHCLREQLNTGPAPSLTPEQKARYDPDFRPGKLNAEPASIIESGRCAIVLARIASELLKDDAVRPSWLRETLAQERNCFIGANHSERDNTGRWAYGIDAPGKVATFGVEDVVGARPGDRCGDCGRVF